MDDYRLLITDLELNYRNKFFSGDHSNVLDLSIECSVCSMNLNWMMLFKKHIFKHPILEVLLCEGCNEPHKSNDWIDCCIWCGLKQEKVIICNECPAKFCQKCIQNNYGLSGITEAFFKDWRCFICDQKRLWELRAICDAAEKLAKDLKMLEQCASKNNVKKCCFCKRESLTIKELSCEHRFHEECYNKWAEKSGRCPLCRAVIQR